MRGYRFEKEKFVLAGLTPVASETVSAPRAAECPVQLEAVVAGYHDLAMSDEKACGRSVIFELRIRRVHLARSILLNGNMERIERGK